MSEQYRYIGARLPAATSPAKARGSTLYGADLPLPGNLCGKLLRSPYAHARIKAIRLDRALGLEGVKAVVTAQDIPEPRGDQTLRIGGSVIPARTLSLLAMARDRVLFHGHPVAAVAAEDEETAQHALDLIQVEYEGLPAILELEQAMQAGSPLIHQELFTLNPLGARVSQTPSNVAMRWEMGRGNVDQGLAQADIVIQETYIISAAHQGYLEPPVCTANVGADGRITVWSATQGSFSLRLQLAAILCLPMNSIVVMPTELGGAFGGKIYATSEPIAMLLAMKSRRPVRMVMTREETLGATGAASGARFQIMTGCRRDGTITAVEVEAAYDAGCLPGSPVAAGLQTAVAPYGKVPHLRLVGYDVVTNKPRVNPYRAPGAAQAAFAVEQNIDAMAKAIGMDPVEFRLKNASEEGDPQPDGRPFGPIGLKEVLERAQRHLHSLGPVRGQGRGRGFAVGCWFGGASTTQVQLTLNPDGSALLLMGCPDMTESRTAVRQLVAEGLKISPDQVAVIIGNTDQTLYCDVTGGSRMTYTLSSAIPEACQGIVAQLKARAGEKYQTSPEMLVLGGRRIWEAGNPGKAWPLESVIPQQGLVARGAVLDLPRAPVFTAGSADVQVDPDTGMVRVLSYVAFQDVGRLVNPLIVEGQIQGGVTQAIGWALVEEMLYGTDGKLSNNTLCDYHEPVALGLPRIEAVPVEVPASAGPYGVRGVGEAPIVAPAATLANAVHNATGARVRHMPMTPERIYWALRACPIDRMAIAEVGEPCCKDTMLFRLGGS